MVASATCSVTISPTASIKNTLRYGQYERDLMPSAPRLNAAGAPTDNTPMKLEHKTRLGELDIWSNQTDFNFKLFTGPLTHNILTGAEIGRETSDVTSWRHKSGANLTGGTVGNPDHNLRPSDPTPVITGQTEFTVDTLAVYLQDMIEFTPEWKLLLGARDGKGYLSFRGQQVDYPQAGTAAQAFLQDSFIGLVLSGQEHTSP